MSAEVAVAAEQELTAAGVVDTLKRCGLTHLVWLPDSEAGFLHAALTTDPDLTLVPVCREGGSDGRRARPDGRGAGARRW